MWYDRNVYPQVTGHMRELCNYGAGPAEMY